MSYRTACHRALPLLAALLVAACSTPSVDTFHSPFTPPDQPTRITVHNGHWERLTIYLERDGATFRLGDVEGMDRAILRVPNEYLASHVPVRLVGRQAGRPAHVVSTYFELSRGQRAEWATGPMDHPTPVTVLLSTG